MNIFPVLFYLSIGFLLITFIDVFGSILSRILNFKYQRLWLLSLTVFLGIGYMVSKELGLFYAAIVNAVIGIFDGTVGLRLSIALKANTGLDKEKMMSLATPKMAVIMAFIAVFFAFIGYFILTIV